MDYNGPATAELDNVAVLNRRFVELATRGNPLPATPDELGQTLTTLSTCERGRLSKAPFLLFSLAGSEPDLWRREVWGPQRDLLADAMTMPEQEWRLVTSTLAFLWTLAQRNRYAARLVAGVSDEWCAVVSDQSLLGVLEIAAGYEHLVVPRRPVDRAFWRRLIAGSQLGDRAGRLATRYSAFQRVLTDREDERQRRVAVAACRRADTALAVAEAQGRRRVRP